MTLSPWDSIVFSLENPPFSVNLCSPNPGGRYRFSVLRDHPVHDDHFEGAVAFFRTEFVRYGNLSDGLGTYHDRLDLRGRNPRTEVVVELCYDVPPTGKLFVQVGLEFADPLFIVEVGDLP